MTKPLLAGVATIFLISGAVSAQTYPSPPPADPPAALPVPVPPPVSAPGSSTSTSTTVAPTPDGGYRASTINKSVDPSGNGVIKKDLYKEGVTGSSETHTKTETDPLGERTTRSTTTTTPQ
jgi:hypothetical protein